MFFAGNEYSFTDFTDNGSGAVRIVIVPRYMLAVYLNLNCVYSIIGGCDGYRLNFIGGFKSKAEILRRYRSVVNLCRLDISFYSAALLKASYDGFVCV